MAVFVREAAAGFAFVLDPVTDFLLEWATEFARPNHVRFAYSALRDEFLDALEERGVTQFVADHHDAVTAAADLDQAVTLSPRDAARFFEKEIFAGRENFLSEL